MEQYKESVLEAKLDILIEDFQRFRNMQETINKELTRHSSDETAVQAKILTTLKWHTVIGGFMATAILASWIKIFDLQG